VFLFTWYCLLANRCCRYQSTVSSSPSSGPRARLETDQLLLIALRCRRTSPGQGASWTIGTSISRTASISRTSRFIEILPWSNVHHLPAGHRFFVGTDGSIGNLRREYKSRVCSPSP